MNLLDWLENFVQRNVRISDNWKAHHSIDEYWVELEKRFDKFIQTTNFRVEFSYTAIPDELLTLTEAHKHEIREKFELLKENFYPSTMLFLTKILADYEHADDLDNPIPTAILKLREYVNQLFQEHFPEQHAQISQELAKIHQKHNQNTKAKAKIKCPECGSTNIKSYGDSWKCRQCGRKFLKHPRTKHYQIKRKA